MLEHVYIIRTLTDVEHFCSYNTVGIFVITIKKIILNVIVKKMLRNYTEMIYNITESHLNESLSVEKK